MNVVRAHGRGSMKSVNGVDDIIQAGIQVRSNYISSLMWGRCIRGCS